MYVLREKKGKIYHTGGEVGTLVWRIQTYEHDHLGKCTQAKRKKNMVQVAELVYRMKT